MLDVGCPMPDARCSMFDVRCSDGWRSDVPRLAVASLRYEIPPPQAGKMSLRELSAAAQGTAFADCDSLRHPARTQPSAPFFVDHERPAPEGFLRGATGPRRARTSEVPRPTPDVQVPRSEL